ncbi:MAG: DNA-binding response regulator [Bacteroidetes bacterium GWA2_32_17]|nr:MAG: DNA-binding response regulator [Bacteroidetes bacterium GWA2_32_17]
MENINYKILLVDDEPDILEFLSYNLIKEGYTVLTANNGKEAIKISEKEIPHLIILDVMMPEIDGIEVCEILRKNQNLSHSVITFLTARGEDYSQIAGFEAGADDYITKPIKPKLFITRIKALLKRFEFPNSKSTEKGYISNNLIIDIDKYIVIANGKEINLPKKEFELLVLLTSNPEKVFTRDEIYYSIWGSEVIVGDRTIDVHIRKLREKIGDSHIQTIKGVGYRFIE